MPTETNIEQLVINKLTQAKYDELDAAGQVLLDQLYLITDGETNAINVIYNNQKTKLKATNVQDAIDEINAKIGSGSQTAVLYTEQTLEEPQKEQARTNIGATNVGLGLTGASINDKAVVSEVNINGVPIKWKLQGKWEVIEEKTINESKEVSFTEEPDKTPYNFCAFDILVQQPEAIGRVTNWYTAHDAKIASSSEFKAPPDCQFMRILVLPINGEYIGVTFTGRGKESMAIMQTGVAYFLETTKSLNKFYSYNPVNPGTKITIKAVRA